MYDDGYGVFDCEDCGLSFSFYEQLLEHMAEKRTVEKKEKDGYVKVKFHELKKGDLFKLYEPDGTPVRFRGSDIYIALSDAYIDNARYVWTIDTKNYKEE